MTDAPDTIQLLGKTATGQSICHEQTYHVSRFPFNAVVCDGAEFSFAIWQLWLFDTSVLSAHGTGDSYESAADACEARARELIADMTWYHDS